MGSNVCQSYRRQTVSTQCPVSTLSLSLPASHPRPVTTGLRSPGVWPHRPLVTVHVYSISLQTPASLPRPAEPDTFLLSLFTRPLSLSDGNLKSRKMLSPPAVTATAVKTKGSKKYFKINSKLTHQSIKKGKKETSNNPRGMMSNI